MSRPLRLAAAATLALAGGAARAETLADALASAYRTNPVLQGRRAELDVLEEGVVQARTALRPTVGLTVSADYARTDLGRGEGRLIDTGSGVVDTGGGATRVESNLGQAQLAVTQPLYTGGRATWAVRGAQAEAAAGRERVRRTEAEVLQGVIQAFGDVRRDQDQLAVRDADLVTLERQAQEAAAKFQQGQVTRTDVAQADTQREAARAAVAAARAQLEISRAAYLAVVGAPAGELATPGVLPSLPASLDEAFTLAERQGPAVQESRRLEDASRARITELRAAYRPTVALQAGLGYRGAVVPLSGGDYDRAVTGGLVLTQPLFTGGLRSSQVRQAVAQNAADRLAVETQRRSAVQAAAQAWNQLLAARTAGAAAEAQVTAAETALRGAQAEYQYGLRTTLDVLIIDENLRAAQLSLSSRRRDELVAQGAVLAAAGRLDATHLLPAEPRFDPSRRERQLARAGATPWEPIVASIDALGAGVDKR